MYKYKQGNKKIKEYPARVKFDPLLANFAPTLKLAKYARCYYSEIEK